MVYNIQITLDVHPKQTVLQMLFNIVFCRINFQELLSNGWLIGLTLPICSNLLCCAIPFIF
jgi:hypothetical protein